MAKYVIKHDADKLTAALKKSVSKLKSEVKDAMKEIGETIVFKSIEYTPRPGWPIPDPVVPYDSYSTTGNLKRSIKSRVKGWKETIVEAGGDIAPYAVYVHYGTRKMMPRPFIDRAVAELEPLFEKRLEEALLNAIK